MGALTKAIYERLASDPELRAMLATYQGHPAIFTGDPPGDAQFPMILVHGPHSDTPDDTKTSLGREVMRDIACYTEGTGSVADVEAIAERVRQLFHRASLPVDGYRVWLVQASGPTTSSDRDDKVQGRVVTLRLRMQQTG